jgi:hypothetical protein
VRDFATQLDKLSTGKKIDNEHKTLVFSSPIDKPTDKIIPKIPKAQIISSLVQMPKQIEKKIELPNPYSLPRQLPAIEFKFNNNKVNTPVSNTKHIAYPNQRTMIPKNAINELVITRKCKKCEQ